MSNAVFASGPTTDRTARKWKKLVFFYDETLNCLFTGDESTLGGLKACITELAAVADVDRTNLPSDGTISGITIPADGDFSGITIPADGTIAGLTFTATPTGAECEALRDECEILRDAVATLLTECEELRDGNATLLTECEKLRDALKENMDVTDTIIARLESEGILATS